MSISHHDVKNEFKHLTDQQLIDRSKKIVPGGVHSPVRSFKSVGGAPIFIQSADGAFLYDVHGKKYIDFCHSWGPLILGHQDPDVKEAVIEAIHRGWTYGAAETTSLELAEWITREIPWVKKIRFVCSGTEAVMSALRVARAATGRSRILKFDGCYHGHVDSLLVKAGSGLVDQAVPDSAGISKGIASETITVPLDDELCLKEAFAKFGSEIAAVILEPLPANNGLLLQRDEWIRLVYKEARKAGTLVIFDEVISGFRVGLQGMAGRFDFDKPDLVTYGKIIGGGFPVGAYGGRLDLMSLVAPEGPVYQAGTLAANPVGMTAGLVTLEKCKRENVYSILRERSVEFKMEVERMAMKYDVSLNIQSDESVFWGVMGGSESVSGRQRQDQGKNVSDIVRRPEDAPANHKTLYSKLFHLLTDAGVYLAPSAFEVGFLSYAHTAGVLDQALSGFETAFKKLRS